MANLTEKVKVHMNNISNLTDETNKATSELYTEVSMLIKVSYEIRVLSLIKYIGYSFFISLIKVYVATPPILTVYKIYFVGGLVMENLMFCYQY